jgi:tyrosinase
MKATGSGTPVNWVFQWYTHAVRGDSTKAAQLNAIYGPGSSPNKTLATQTWSTCQAHFSPQNERFFLPWHRMFVFYLERICAKVLNDTTFTLPYWNYSSPTGAAIPQAFRVQNSSLFRSNRNPGVNTGQAIGTPAMLSPASALAQANYLPQSNAIRGFNETLDSGLHGTVHVRVGNTTNMGAVPFAANDPIFWMHHCNIDRLWASWNRCGRKNPTDASWLNQTFTFANENGGTAVAKVSDFDTTKELGYTYDFFEPVSQCVPSPAVTAAASEPRESKSVTLATSAKPMGAAATGGITLGGGPVRVTLSSPRTVGAAVPPPPLGARVEQLPDTSQIYLVIKNLRAAAQPGVLYHLYVELPSGAPPAVAEGHYVGSINFFDAVPLPDHEGHAAAAPDIAGKTFSFEVTDVVRRLRSEGKLGDSPSVMIVPAGTPVAQAKPVVGEIEIVEE